MRFLLACRALFFVVLMPGTVAIYVPYRIVLAAGHLRAPAVGVASLTALVLVLLGALVLLKCVWDFFAAGKGTLAPVDPPRELVVRGLYRYTRNPMYNGVLAMLAGEAWLFDSAEVLEYGLLVLLAFHLMVVLYEERTLAARFPEAYRAYRRAVPRWGFTVRPYRDGSDHAT
jgi:protein-S-isoprenylcysteine O-methyltransferase Ste14